MNLRHPSQALVGLLFLLWSSAGFAATWRQVTPEELSAKQSMRDPSADAEALFREVRVLNGSTTSGYPQSVISEYVRLKVFTDRGRKYGTVQIPYSGKSSISNLAGRTIHADGSIVELGKDAIFDKVIVNTRGKKVKVKAFAMPAVETGSIIEYQWTRYVGEFISRYIPLDVQSEFPTDEVTFHIKPVSSPYVYWPPMRYIPFHCKVDMGAAPDNRGFSVLTVRNVPAFHEEPLMPPEYSQKQWILVYYEENGKSKSEQYWKSYGRGLYSDYSQKVRVNNDVKQLAIRTMGAAKSDEEKVANLLTYCRKNLHDVNGPDLPTEQRATTKENRTTIDTLKQGSGTAEEIAYAFAAMSTAAGFEARVVRLSDRGTFLFSPNIPSAYFLNSYDIAVKLHGKWVFYDVGNQNLPPGVLPWREEGVPALVVDNKDPEFVTTPLLSAEESRVARFGTLKLSADGTLEGDLHEVFMGNKATEQREQISLMNNAEREDRLREELKQRFASFELTKVRYTAVEDLTKSVGLTYHVKIDGYAQQTGKRLFLNPAYFEAGIGSFFTSDKRELPVYFEYPWSESDVISIQLPDGYQLDHGQAPGSVVFAPVGSYSVQMFMDQRTLQYRRSLTFGQDQLLLFNQELYPTIKQIFDRIHTSDNQMLALKIDSAGPPTVQLQ
jgi:hypothetical protein